jgi:hypothetical protein
MYHPFDEDQDKEEKIKERITIGVQVYKMMKREKPNFVNSIYSTYERD